jgi:hypothetical protein
MLILASDDEKARLLAWKRYRVLLSRVDLRAENLAGHKFRTMEMNSRSPSYARMGLRLNDKFQINENSKTASHGWL